MKLELEIEWCLRVDDRSEETLDGRRNSRSDESRQCGRSAERANLEPFSGDVIAGSGDQSRVRQTRGGGTLGQWPMVPGERERTQRNDELRLEVGDKTAEGLVVRAKRAPVPPSMDEWDDHLSAGHVKYRGWCLLCVVSPFHVVEGHSASLDCGQACGHCDLERHMAAESSRGG